jgi:cell division protein FtsB
VKSIAFYKFLVAGLAVMLVLTGVLSALLILQARRELDHYNREENDLHGQLKDLQVQLAQREEFLDRLENDPAFLEREVRQRLGYSKPDEMIYRFDVDPLTSTPIPGYSPAPDTPPKSSSSKTPASKPAASKTPAPSNHTITYH